MKKNNKTLQVSIVLIGLFGSHAISQNLLIGNGGGGGGGGAATGSGGGGGGGGGITAGTGGKGGIGRVGGSGGTGDNNGTAGSNAGTGGKGGDGTISAGSNIVINASQDNKNWNIIAIGGSGGGGGGGGGGGPGGVGLGGNASGTIAGDGGVRGSGGRGGGKGAAGQNGRLEINGVTVNVSNYLRVGGLNGTSGSNGGNGNGNNGGAGGNGELTLSNGAVINIGSNFIIGTDVAGASGIVNLKDNSTINFMNSGIFTINTNGTLNVGGIISSSMRGTGGTISNAQNIQNAGIINFNQSNSTLISSTISGAGKIIVNGGSTGITILEKNNTYTGGTTITSGTLQLGNSGTTGLVVGNIVNNGILTFNRNDSLSFSNIISGSGSVHQIGNGRLTLAGNNTYSGETLVSTGILVAGSANALTQNSKYTVKDGGTLNLNNYNLSVSSLSGEDGFVELGNADLTFNLINNNKFSGVINGTGGLIKSGVSTLTLSGENTYTRGTDVTAGTLSLTNKDAAGIGSIILSNGTTLSLDFNDRTFTNQLSNQSTNDRAYVVVTGENVAINRDNFDFNGTWNIKSGGSVYASSINENLGNTSSVNIENTGKLSLNADQGYIGNSISGEGILEIDLNDKSNVLAFIPGYNVDNFTGMIALNTGTIDINNGASYSFNNLSALNVGATFSLGANGVLETSKQKRTIGNLELNGGTVNIGLSAGDRANYLTVTDLTVKGGTIFIDTDNIPDWNFEDNVGPGSPINPIDNFFNQANTDSDNKIILIEVTGDKQVESGSQVNIDYSSKGNTVVVSTNTDSDGYTLNTTYDYVGLMSNTNNSLGNGIYLNYALTQVEMEKTAAGDPGRLILTTNGADASKFTDGNFGFGAKITGEGNVTYVAGSGEKILLQAANDYIGDSIVNSGTALVLGNNNALGQTGLLDVQIDSLVDLAGHNQTIKSLQNNGDLNLGTDGTLNIIGDFNNTSPVDNVLGKISGTGELNFMGGVTIADVANNNLSADISIGSDTSNAPTASVQIRDLLALGNNYISVNTSGELVLSGLNGLLNNTVSGTGTLSVADNSKITLTDNSTFNGQANIEDANTLTVSNLGTNASVSNNGDFIYNVVNDTNRILSETNRIDGSGNFVKTGTGTLVVEANLTYTGETTIDSGELKFNGSNAQLSGTSLVNIAENAMVSGSGIIKGDVINDGSFIVGLSTPEESINRANVINNFNVSGGFNNNGTISLSSSGLGSKLVIDGDYIGNDGDLRLSTKLEGDNSETQLVSIGGDATGNTSVYVTNVGGLGAQTTNGIKIIEVAGTSDANAFVLKNSVVAGNYEYLLQESGEDWVLASHAINGNGNGSWYRPDAGLNMGVGTAAVGLLTPEIGSFAIRGRGDKDSNVWMTADYRKTKGKGAYGQLGFKNTIKGMQLGVDHTFATGDQSLTLGIMASTHKIDGKANNRITGSRATSDTDAYGFGLYGTWYLDNANLSPYVDVYAQYQKFKTTNKTLGNASYKYHSHGTSFTAIGGYPIALDANMVLEPQVQLGYVDYQSDTFRDHNGNLSKTTLKGNFIGRVGAVLTFNKDSIIEPYIGANVWYDNTQVSTRYGDNVSLGRFEALKSYKNGAMFEGKLGFNANSSKDLTFWGEARGLTGSHSAKDYGLSVGIKYSF